MVGRGMRDGEPGEAKVFIVGNQDDQDIVQDLLDSTPENPFKQGDQVLSAICQDLKERNPNSTALKNDTVGEP